jgi:very-short-patch-repair endonuclease
MILPGTGRGTAPARRGGGGSSPKQRPEIYLARKLRKAMSVPEVMLWQRMRGGRLGFKVRRQHPIGPYVADFCYLEARLVIEIDGQVHAFGNRPERDADRDRYMIKKGYALLRIAAEDVLKDADAVADGIVARMTNPLHHPSDGLPPRSGEEI